MPIKKRHNGSGRYMNSILYTPRRAPLSEEDFVPKKRKKTVKDQISDRAHALGQAAARSVRSRKDYHSYKAQRKRRPREEATDIKRFMFRDATFYGSVTVCALALILVTFVLTSSIIGNFMSSQVTVNDNGRVSYAATDATTVSNFLNKNDIKLNDGDVLNLSLNASIKNGETIEIRRAKSVTINDGSKEVKTNMLAGTVSEALSKAGIEIAEDDEVYPSGTTYVTEGMTINVIHVTYKYETENEVIHYKEVSKSSSAVSYGDEIVQTEGQNGSQQNTIKVTYKNGKEVSRETVKTEITKKAVDRVILVGTYVAPTPTPEPSPSQNSGGGSSSGGSSSGGSSSGSSSGGSSSGGSSSGGSSSGGKAESTKKPDTGADIDKDDTGKLTKVPTVSQIHSGSLYEHKNVAAPASTLISKVIVMNSITAYTHTGSRTATGTWPRIGTIAADPKQIPYGTKLYIPGYGYGRVEDTGSNKHAADYYCIDLFMETEADCVSYGRKSNVKVYVLNG